MPQVHALLRSLRRELVIPRVPELWISLGRGLARRLVPFFEALPPQPRVGFRFDLGVVFRFSLGEEEQRAGLRELFPSFVGVVAERVVLPRFDRSFVMC